MGSPVGAYRHPPPHACFQQEEAWIKAKAGEDFHRERPERRVRRWFPGLGMRSGEYPWHPQWQPASDDSFLSWSKASASPWRIQEGKDPRDPKRALVRAPSQVCAGTGTTWVCAQPHYLVRKWYLTGTSGVCCFQFLSKMDFKTLTLSQLVYLETSFPGHVEMRAAPASHPAKRELMNARR